MGSEKHQVKFWKKWIDIKYDYMPKYCSNCKLQGHDEQECYVLHPELYKKDGEKKEGELNIIEQTGKETDRDKTKDNAADKDNFQSQKGRRVQWGG